MPDVITDLGNVKRGHSTLTVKLKSSITFDRLDLLETFLLLEDHQQILPVESHTGDHKEDCLFPGRQVVVW